MADPKLLRRVRVINHDPEDVDRLDVTAAGTHTSGWKNGRSEVVWDTLPKVGSFHETSAYPGQGGNTVINGHRDIRGSVFRRLDQLQAGDEVIVYGGDIAYTPALWPRSSNSPLDTPLLNKRPSICSSWGPCLKSA